MSIFSEEDIKQAAHEANLDQQRTVLKADFIQYLKDHPEERLHQAYRNFMGVPFIIACERLPNDFEGIGEWHDIFSSDRRNGK